jgi:cell division protein FtsZ
MAHADANIIFGAQLDDSLEDEMRITVVATGLGDNKKNKTNELDILIGNTENKEFDDDIGLLDIFKN